MKYFLLIITMLLIGVYFLNNNVNYDVSKIKNHNGCYFYANNDDIIAIAALLIEQNFGKNELKNQKKLSIHRTDGFEIEVRGNPLPLYVQRIIFGGGGIVVDLEKNNQCLVLHKIYKQK